MLSLFEPGIIALLFEMNWPATRRQVTGLLHAPINLFSPFLIYGFDFPARRQGVNSMREIPIPWLQA